MESSFASSIQVSLTRDSIKIPPAFYIYELGSYELSTYGYRAILIDFFDCSNSYDIFH